MKKTTDKKKQIPSDSPTGGKEETFSRKDFLKVGGLTAVTVAGLSSCNEVPNSIASTPPIEIGKDPNPDNEKIWIGAGDIGLLNTYHIQSRVLNAFFETILEQPYLGITQEETQLITDIKLHKKAHSDFLSAYLKENAIPDIHFNFDNINFDNRSEVLDQGYLFSNVSVGACNCFPPMLERRELSTLFTTIASVEARHAVVLKYLLNPNSNFISGDVIDNNRGLDAFTNPKGTWATIQPFIEESFDIQELPKQQF